MCVSHSVSVCDCVRVGVCLHIGKVTEKGTQSLQSAVRAKKYFSHTHSHLVTLCDCVTQLETSIPMAEIVPLYRHWLRARYVRLLVVEFVSSRQSSSESSESSVIVGVVVSRILVCHARLVPRSSCATLVACHAHLVPRSSCAMLFVCHARLVPCSSCAMLVL